MKRNIIKPNKKQPNATMNSLGVENPPRLKANEKKELEAIELLSRIREMKGIRHEILTNSIMAKKSEKSNNLKNGHLSSGGRVDNILEIIDKKASKNRGKIILRTHFPEFSDTHDLNN